MVNVVEILVHATSDAAKVLAETEAAGKRAGTSLRATGADARVASSGVAGIASATKLADGSFMDAQGRWRRANGQFMTDAQRSAAGVRNLGTAATAAGTRFEALHAKMIQVGKIAGLAFLAAGAASIKMAADYQTAITRLAGGANEQDKNLKMMGDGILKLSGQVGFSALELAKAQYQISSSGYHGAEGLNVLRAAAEGAKVEQADLIPVTNAVLDILKDYHMPASQAATATSQLVKAISYGRVDLTSFSRALANIVPLGAAVGLKFGDISAALAMMTNHGMTAQRASQNLANAIRSIEGPTSIMTKEWKTFGITQQQVDKSMGKVGLTGTLEMLAEAAKKNAVAHGETFAGALKKLTGTAPGLVSALMTTGKYYGESKDAIKGISEAGTEAGDHVEGWARVQQTLNQQLSEFTNSVASLAIQIGQKLLPPLTQALTFLNNHHGVFLVIAGIVGGVLTAAFLTWAASVIAATWPILAIIAAVAALVVGFMYLWNHFAGFRQFWITTWKVIQQAAIAAWTVIKPAIMAGWQWLQGVWRAMVKMGAEVMASIMKWWKTHGQQIMQLTQTIWNGIKHVFDIVWPALMLIVKAGWAVIVGVFKMAWHTVVAVVKLGWDTLVGIFNVFIDVLTGHWGQAWTDLKNTVVQGVKAIADWFRNMASDIGGIFSGLGSAVVQYGKDIVMGLVHGIEAAAGQAKAAVENIGSSMLGGLKSVLGISSPSKKFYAIASWIPAGIAKGIESSKQQAIITMQRLGEEVHRTGNAWIEDFVNKTGGKLVGFSDKYQQMVSRVKTAQAQLKSLMDASAKMSADVASRIMDTGSLANLGGGSGMIPTAGGMISELQARVQQAQQFGALMQQLKKAGLNSTAMGQLGEMDPVQGIGYAQNILAGGAGGIKQINLLQSQLSKTATSTGKQVADAMYGNGIKAAQGLVAGLQSQEKALIASIEKLVTEMVKRVKKGLRISSPSRVFEDEIGKMIPAGIASGIMKGMPVVNSALGTTPAGLPAAHGRAQGGRQTIVVEYRGDPAVLAFLRRVVRIYGRGNVQVAIGTN